MRFTIQLPDPLIEILRNQAREAHRPPKHHAEYLLMQALRDHNVSTAVSTPPHNPGRQQEPDYERA